MNNKLIFILGMIFAIGIVSGIPQTFNIKGNFYKNKKEVRYKNIT